MRYRAEFPDDQESTQHSQERRKGPTNDGNTIRKLLHVLSRGIQGIEVVQLRKRTKEVLRGPHFVPDDDPTLPRALDLKELDHGPEALFDAPHDLLVNLERVLGRLFEEEFVGDRANIRPLLPSFPAIVSRRRRRCAGDSTLGENTLRDEITTE